MPWADALWGLTDQPGLLVLDRCVIEVMQVFKVQKCLLSTVMQFILLLKRAIIKNLNWNWEYKGTKIAINNK